MDQGSSADEQSRRAFSSADGGRIVGYLPAGVILWGGLGKLLDHWTDSTFFTPIGLALGLVLGTYLVIHRCVRIPQMEAQELTADSENTVVGPKPVVEGAQR
jgi:F0F1-type ATP synthase assembly protein I